MNLKDLNILFLAKFAPNNNEYPLVTEQTDGIYAQYHYEIFKILQKICPKTICAHDPNILFNSDIQFDYVFSLLNRAPYKNSEIFVSSLLEYLDIPYLGSRPNIRAIAEDKHLAKIVAQHAGLHTPLWMVIDANEPLTSKPLFGGPYFVKPRFGASSAFIDEMSIANSWEQALVQIVKLQKNNFDVIIEQFVDGIYYSVPIYFKNGQVVHLPTVKEISNLQGNVVTYRQKRKLQGGLTRLINNDLNLEKKFKNLSDSFLCQLQPLDYTRLDFIVTADCIEFIEFNLCCNLGKQSSFCIAAKEYGISQETLVKEIFFNSLSRQKII